MRCLQLLRFTVFGAALFFISEVRAGDAACSPDGKLIYRLSWVNERDGVEVIDTETKKRTILQLPGEVPGEGLTGLSMSNAGHLLLAFPDAVWAFDPEKKKVARVCGAPQGGKIQGISYDPATSAVYLTVWAETTELRSDLWILPKNAKKPLPVVNRRAGPIAGLNFLADGRIVFAARGDLWIGIVNLEDEENEIWSLEAIRFAPVGEWETANATSNSYGARDVAPGPDSVWVHVGRLGGSGSGRILKVPAPKADLEEATYKSMSEALAALQDLGETGTRAWLCGNSKSGLVYYFLDGGQLMRAAGDKDPAEVGTFSEE